MEILNFKNWEPELQKRVMTGVAGAAGLILLILFGGRLGMGILVAVISLMMLHEFLQMTLALPDKREKSFALLGTAWLMQFANFVAPRVELEVFLLSFLGIFSYFLFSANRDRGEGNVQLEAHFRELMTSVFGIFYLAVLPLFILLVHDAVYGAKWTLVFFLINWAGDSGAYFVGRKYGKTKLYPLISPKKTREGAVGGLASGLVVTLLFKVLFFRAMPWAGVIIIPIVVGVFAQLGDLFESFLKRAFATKDSGSILPGHGGFLDRFDGVVISAPVMYACTRIFGAS